jgi:hypothetical protein
MLHTKPLHASLGASRRRPRNPVDSRSQEKPDTWQISTAKLPSLDEERWVRHASRAALAASGELLPSPAAQWLPLPDEALFTKALGLVRPDLSVVEVRRDRQDSP